MNISSGEPTFRLRPEAAKQVGFVNVCFPPKRTFSRIATLEETQGSKRGVVPNAITRARALDLDLSGKDTPLRLRCGPDSQGAARGHRRDDPVQALVGRPAILELAEESLRLSGAREIRWIPWDAIVTAG